MNEAQAAKWEKKSWKKIDMAKKYENEPVPPRNWRKIFKMFFPEWDTIPSHGQAPRSPSMVKLVTNHLHL